MITVFLTHLLFLGGRIRAAGGHLLLLGFCLLRVLLLVFGLLAGNSEEAGL